MENNKKTTNAALRNRVKMLLSYMAEGLYEKDNIIAMSLLAAIAGENIFLLGPPGTAKSMIARSLKKIFSNATSFEYLMSRFSTPDELFGPVSISKLKDEDRYERIVEGYLPTADVVFLDEIWKAGPSIQNALLTAINEHIFQNGTKSIEIKMKVLIAASNELPNEDEGLEALWDRFLIRDISNCISDKENFRKMIIGDITQGTSVSEEDLIDNETYLLWKRSITKVKIPTAIIDQVCYIRDKMNDKNQRGLDFYVSDRRWKKIFHLMQTSAFLNGRDEIETSDLAILYHTLWNKIETIKDVSDIISLSLTHELESKLDSCGKLVDKIIKSLVEEHAQKINTDEEEEEYATVNFFYYALENYPNGECLFAKTDYNRILVDINTNGMLYYDQKKKCWLLHAFYSDIPTLHNNGGVRMISVNIRKCNGGVIIDDVPYPFRKKSIATAKPKGDSPTKDIDAVLGRLKETLNEKRTAIYKSDNLFMSDKERDLLLRVYDEFERKVNRQMAKNENTSKIYDS